MIESNLISFIPEYEELYKMFSPRLTQDIFVYGEEKANDFYCYVLLNGEKTEIKRNANFCGEIERKRYLKRYTKLCLYKALEKHFNVKQPWGALTGIRPVKFAKSFDNFEEYFSREMEVDDIKINLVKSIIQTQSSLNVQTDKLDLYVGIPFCPSKCYYCSFVSGAVNEKSPVNEYIEALCYEINQAKDLYKNRIGTVYIGGGTPAVLNEEQTEKLLKTLDVPSNVEFTVEAGRPDCITKGKLDIYAKYAVNRICINPQTLNQKTLDLIGRKHTVEQIYSCFKLARNYPFYINMDLIAGLKGENLKDFKNSVDKTVELKPDNVTVHTLCIKAGSSLKRECDYLSDGEIGEMLSYSQKVLTENLYYPYYLYRQKYMAGNYENVGYSLKGKECLYNVGVMEEVTDNLAFGAGANSKIINSDGKIIERYYPPKDVFTYIKNIKIISEEKLKFFSKKIAF